MKDILEKEIQISDLYPPTNVVRTDFTVVLTRFTTRSDSWSKFKMDDRAKISFSKLDGGKNSSNQFRLFSVHKGNTGGMVTFSVEKNRDGSKIEPSQ